MANQDNLLRLLIVEESLNDAEMLISVLRNAGHAVRAERAEDDEDLQALLSQKAFDLLLCAVDHAELPLDAALKLVQQAGKDVPLLAVAAEDDPTRRREAMEAGALDLVSKQDLQHLLLVIRREIGNLGERRRLRRLEQAVRETEKRCHTLLDSSRDAIAYVHEGMHIYANGAYLEQFGFASMDEIEGMPLLDMAAPAAQGKLKDFLRSYGKEGHTEDELEIDMVADDGTPFHVVMHFSHASIEGEPCTQILMRSLASNQELAEQLDTLSKQDMLTGLFNRPYFIEQLEATVGEVVAGGHEGGASMLYAQIDNLDAIMQTLGITGLDQVTSDIAGVIKDELQNDGIAARVTDDVFALLLPNSSVHEAIAIGEAVRARVEEHVSEAGNRTITSTLSIGAIMITETSGSAQQVISAGQQACETARAEGGNRVHLFTPEAERDGAGELKAQLQSALEQDTFFLVYQPIASLQGDARERYEARIRLKTPDGVVLPEDFVPQAEQFGLMPAIDRWVVKRAIKVLTERKAKGVETTLFVKLSGPSLSDPQFVPFLAQALKDASVEGKQLVFQVNEPVAVTQLNQCKELFRGLKALHCGFSLDHFGSGLNPFQLVKHLPADFLKLDTHLTKDLGDNAENQELVKQLIESAHGMNRKVIAGYLEDASSLAMLWQYGTDYVQGYFLAEPEPQLSYDFSGMVI